MFYDQQKQKVWLQVFQYDSKLAWLVDVRI